MLTRRPALAAAFALTMLLGYAIVAYGSQQGIFAWTQGRGSEAAGASFDGEEANPLYGWPEMTPEVIEVSADPLVITEYKYVDQVIPAPSVQQLSAPSAPTIDSMPDQNELHQAEPEPVDEPTNTPYEDEDEDDEHDDRDEDEDEHEHEHEDEDEEDHEDEDEHDEEHDEDDD